MEKGIERIEEGSKMKKYIDSLRTKQMKYQLGNRQAMLAYMNSGSKSSSLSLTDEMNRCQQEADVPE